jgi:hypothetical protein
MEMENFGTRKIILKLESLKYNVPLKDDQFELRAVRRSQAATG